MEDAPAEVNTNLPPDAVVSVSADSDNINVFINSSELNYDTALSIYNMMKNETGIVAGNIIIMPVYAES